MSTAPGRVPQLLSRFGGLRVPGCSFCSQPRISWGDNPLLTADHVVWVSLALPIGPEVGVWLSPGQSELSKPVASMIDSGHNR